MSGWDAETYDLRFSMITELGAPLLELLHAQPGERVLDLGCGPGRQSAELARTGVDVLGIDADPAMIDRATRLHRGIPHLDFALADAQRLPEALSARFDAVLSNAALHWMPDQEAVFRSVRSVLRPGGRFVAEMGAAGNIATVIDVTNAARADLGLPAADDPWVFPTVVELVQRLDRHGLRPDLVHRFDRPTPLGAGDSVASWLRVFGPALVADIPAHERAAFDRHVDEHAADAGLVHQQVDGALRTVADYVRLRFIATAI
ncbi:class I SAM-dependent methyltransferase [Agromyces bauzanensis]